MEGAACAAAVALGAVMAGSGDEPTLRLLRGLRRRLTLAGGPGAVTHGSHVAVSMALGFLFLGGGRSSFGTSPRATAALVASLWPALPVSPPDMRQYVQPLRHLYALAAEPRRLEVVDAASRLLTRAPVVVEPSPSAPVGAVPTLVRAPGLLPERAHVAALRIGGGRFWPVRVAGPSLDALYASRRLHVRRAAGAAAHGARGGGAASRLAAALRDGPPGGAAAVGASVTELCTRFGADPATSQLAAVVGGWRTRAAPGRDAALARRARDNARRRRRPGSHRLPAWRRAPRCVCWLRWVAEAARPPRGRWRAARRRLCVRRGVALARAAAASPSAVGAAVVRAAALAARGRGVDAGGGRSPLATPDGSDGGGAPSDADPSAADAAAPAPPLPGAPSPPSSRDGSPTPTGHRRPPRLRPPPPPGVDRWDSAARGAAADARWHRLAAAAADALPVAAALVNGSVPASAPPALVDAAASLLAGAGVPPGAAAALARARGAVAAGRDPLPDLAASLPRVGVDALRLLAKMSVVE